MFPDEYIDSREKDCQVLERLCMRFMQDDTMQSTNTANGDITSCKVVQEKVLTAQFKLNKTWISS